MKLPMGKDEATAISSNQQSTQIAGKRLLLTVLRQLLSLLVS